MSESDPEDKSGRPPGGVQHDGRGNAVWQWAAESGRHVVDSTSRLLKRLEVPGLSVEGEEPEEEKQQKQLELKEQQKASGYNPYETPRNTQSSSRGPAPPAPPKQAARPPVQQEKSWLGKLFKKDQE